MTARCLAVPGAVGPSGPLYQEPAPCRKHPYRRRHITALTSKQKKRIIIQSLQKTLNQFVETVEEEEKATEEEII